MNNFPHWIDHLLAFVFSVALPLFSIRQYRFKPNRPFTSGEKKHIYLFGSLNLFILGLVVMVVWLFFRRPVTELGFMNPVNPGSWWWIVLVLVLLYFLDAFISVSTKEKLKDSIETWKQRTPFVPAQKNELPLYFLLCVSAGVCEELVYRGYLISYCQHLFQASPNSEALSVMLPAVVFSAAHYYQGFKAVMKILVLSVFFGFIFLRSGSLIPVIMLHFLIDAAGGLFTVAFSKKEIVQVSKDEINTSTPEHES
jgi:membrane protease YdiL (CAAX protease family)